MSISYKASFIIIFLIAATAVYLNLYDGRELARNYEKNRIEILALRDFAREIRPRGVWFDLRLDGALVETFRAESADKNQTASFIRVDKRTSVQEPLRILGWDEQTFSQLKAKLKSANVIGVRIWDNDETTIDYRDDGFGVAYYEIFDDASDEILRGDKEAGCDDRFHSDGVALLYGGGATVGFMCVNKDGKNIKRR
ncbi:hypothetical protein [Campylobacter showae]|jgi:hypothetical protein|uniref:hypothetical protein n=1 Tax=Campylobacter showae TaxID=204 RepID=UPI000F089513|nr:hypothetical protein [Campylobacter showae]